MTKETSEEHRKGILASVSKFLNRDNIYASKIVTYPHTPSIEMDSIGDTNSNDIVHLYFDEKSDFINGEFERKLCLVADYWVETKILWHSAWLPMEQFPEAYKMFLNKYEQLDGEKKATKEEIEKYRKELEMWWGKRKEEEKQQQEDMTSEQEKELIVKNAFEFLKREDLVLKGNNIILPLSEERKIKKDYTVNQLCYNGISINIFYIKNKTLYFLYEYTNKDLIELFNKKLNELQAKQQQTEQRQDDYYTRKHDKGKPKLLQVPVEAIQAISEIMDYGSNKYGANSWQCVEIERYLQAGARHLYATQKDIGAKDEESGIEHLKHALCNLAYAVVLYEMGKADEK